MFVEADTPDIGGFCKHRVMDSSLIIFTKTLPARQVNCKFPLSVTVLDKSFHAQTITPTDMKHLVHALGQNGSYESRVIVNSFGSISYLGFKERGSRSRSTPSEEPGMRDRYCYYRRREKRSSPLDEREQHVCSREEDHLVLRTVGDVKMTQCALLVMQVVEFMHEYVRLKETQKNKFNVYVTVSSVQGK